MIEEIPPEGRMRNVNLPIVLLPVLLLFSAETNIQPAIANLELQSLKAEYRAGEKIQVEYKIQNVGGAPFYMNPNVAQVGGMDAGVRLALFDEAGNPVSGQIVGDVPVPDYSKVPDLCAYIRERWLLLRPGMFYGLNTYYPTIVTLRPGRYRLLATYFNNLPSLVTPAQRESMDSLPYPVLVKELQSRDVWFTVVK